MKINFKKISSYACSKEDTTIWCQSKTPTNQHLLSCKYEIFQQIIFPGDLHFSNYVVKFRKSSRYQRNSNWICREKCAQVNFLSFQKEVMRCKHLQNIFDFKILWAKMGKVKGTELPGPEVLTPLINLCIPAQIQPEQYLYLGTGWGIFH